MVSNAKSVLSSLATHAAVNRGGGRCRGRGVLGGSGERVLFSVMQAGSSPSKRMVLNLLIVIFYCENGQIIFSHFKPHHICRLLGKAFQRAAHISLTFDALWEVS